MALQTCLQDMQEARVSGQPPRNRPEPGIWNLWCVELAFSGSLEGRLNSRAGKQDVGSDGVFP
jgi:hypothetical protein